MSSQAESRYAKNDSPIAIVIHGGAGTILREKMSADVEEKYKNKLLESVRAGHEVLVKGGSSLDAVTAAINIMEDSELFNAGRGAVFTHDARVELDASIMDGYDLSAGAVAGIRHIKSPINLARSVMEDSPHVMMVGEGAEQFAKSRGYDRVDNEYFYTDRRRNQLDRALKQENGVSLSEDDNAFETIKGLGTVGAVAIDRAGNISAGTSTGGMTNKRWGRVGDSPIIGAGTYADNQACGISATGHGEFFIRAAVAYDICARVKYREVSLQQSADEVVMDRLKKMGADGGVIGIDPHANVVFSFNSKGMYRAAIDREGKTLLGIFREIEALPISE